MRAKIFVALCALFCASLPLRPQTLRARQNPDSSTTVLPEQPAALAGSHAPTIPPVIAKIWPAGIERGSSATVTLDGRNLAGIKAVLFDAPGLEAHVISVTDVAETAQKIRINVDLSAQVPQGAKQKAQLRLTASSSVAPGIHRLRVQTPLGTSNLVAFDVGSLPEIQTQQPPAGQGQQAQSVTLPATLVGTIAAPGDVNRYEFSGRSGDEVVFRIVASKLGSVLRSVLTLRDSAGKQLAQAGKFSDHPDAVLTYRLPASGLYSIAVRDQEQKGGPGAFYRLDAGDLPYIASVFPLGVRVGHTEEVHVDGVNLGGVHTLSVNPPQNVDGWTTVPVRIKTADGQLSNARELAVIDEPEIDEKEPNDSPAEAQPISVPAVINGRIDHSGASPDQDYFRFAATKGERLTIEAAASRLGSPLDSVIEVLDPQGRPVPRATIRCLNETSLTLADRDSRGRGYRLVSRTGFHVNDYLMVGEELDRIAYISDQPDEDILVAGFGGLRTAFLGTSPEAHYVTEPVYRAEVLPPGAKFPPNGLPVFNVAYRNDDGGPGFGADSRLDFTAPAGGEYVIHIADVRGLQGPDFEYQLLVRKSTPDFTLTASPENPNVPRGGRVPVEITADRTLGYEGPISITFAGLPRGITASHASIPVGQDSVTAILSASDDAPAWAPATPFSVEGRAVAGGKQFVRIADPTAPLRVAALMPPPDVLVAAQPTEIALAPGHSTTVTVHVTRENGFKGRVPCQVENLPPGVTVVNVGLNGVLVHSGENSHTFTLKAENWVQPVTQPIYVVGAVESNATTDHASPPVLLKIETEQETALAHRSP
ncbi:MAG: hypothetical protein ACRD3D_06040 [Terriglobia bacterium]